MVFIYESKKPIKETYYFGRAFNIRDDKYFTKEELVIFAYKICDELEKIFGHRFEVTDVYTMDTSLIYIQIMDEDEQDEESCTLRVDLKKVKNAKDLTKRYLQEYVNRFAHLFNISYRQFRENFRKMRYHR